MIPLYKPAQVRELDELAVKKLQIPSIVLMENAALNIFEILQPPFEKADVQNIAVVCGKGNNGGDGYAIARHLVNAGYSVTVFSLYPKDTLSPDAKVNFRILESYAQEGLLTLISIKTPLRKTLFSGFEVVIEAILGSGFTGTPDEYISPVLKQLNALPSFKIAVDVPAGVNADTGAVSTEAFCADMTITLGGLKRGLFFNSGRLFSGDVYKASIGIAEEFIEHAGSNTFLITPETIASILPPQAKGIHKYSAGKVLHLAGSARYPGAGVLSALASFQAGAGASILCSGSSYVQGQMAFSEPHLVYEIYQDDQTGCFDSSALKQIENKVSWADCIVIGPGLNRNQSTLDAVEILKKNFPGKHYILDADGLPLYGSSSIKIPKNAILTPHTGEFARMLGVTIEELRSNFLHFGSEYSIKNTCFLVLKDHTTVIFTPDGTQYINSSGNSGLAKFGSGDVLSGLLGGFLSRTKDPLQAALCAVYLHGLAADIIKELETEHGVNATRLLEYIPKAVKLIQESCG